MISGTDAQDWIEHLSSSSGLSPDGLADRIYAGRILFFSGLAPVEALVAKTRAILDDVFASEVPPAAFHALGRDGFRRTMRKAQKRFAQSPEIARHWTDALIAAGADPEATYRDRLVLRSAPPNETANGPGYGLLPAHRDSKP